MHIQKIRIENFRSFKDETINLERYTCLVGANGAGKSTVLNALNLFFRNTRDSATDLISLKEDDFHHRNTDEPIVITVTFTDLSVDAKNDLSAYVRQDQLIVKSVVNFDKATGSTTSTQHGIRMVMEPFKKYFASDKDKLLVDELRTIFSELRGEYPDLPNATKKADMMSALRKFEEEKPELCSEAPSQDEFYGVSKGKNLLSPYIQWVFIPASKDISQESEESKNTALGILLERTVRARVNFSEKLADMKKKAREEYQDILNQESVVLDTLSESLNGRLASWAHPGISAKVQWKNDTERSVKVEEPLAQVKIGESGFEGDLNRFGHGLQRSYIFALLQELSSIEDTSAPTLIMGIEEPEIYQHPPQARYLSDVLIELSTKDSQIISCTHSPLFIPRNNVEQVRVVQDASDDVQNSISVVKSVTYDQLETKLTTSGLKLIRSSGLVAKLFPVLTPSINEMFFSKKIVFTEGIEDIAYLTAYIELTGNSDLFREKGIHFIPTGGKSAIAQPLAMSLLFEIPTFVVCDADTNVENESDENKRNSWMALHKRDNKAILNLLGHEQDNEWPDNDLELDSLYMWSTNITDAISNDIGDEWQQEYLSACQHYGGISTRGKNPLVIAHAMEAAWNSGHKSDKLIRVIDKIKCHLT